MKTAIAVDTVRTTDVEFTRSSRVGHVTFNISLRTSPKSVEIFTNIKLHPTPPGDHPGNSGVKVAGQVGLEPTTAGFGDRCSTS